MIMSPKLWVPQALSNLGVLTYACCLDRHLCLQVLHDQIVQFTDAGAAAGNAVVTFDRESLSLLAPRGRFDVEMYLSSLKLTGQVHCAAS